MSNTLRKSQKEKSPEKSLLQLQKQSTKKVGLLKEELSFSVMDSKSNNRTQLIGGKRVVIYLDGVSSGECTGKSGNHINITK